MSVSTKCKRMFTMLAKDPAWVVRRITGYFRPPLFSYQMGKVGSSSIKHTIESRYRVIHCHTLDEFQSNLAKIDARNATESIDMITATRDPIGREISAFFQNITAMHHGYGVGAKNDVLAMDVDELIEIFRDRWARHPILPDTTTWFDRCFQPATGINIYDHDFNRERGWSIIRTGRWRLLVTRFEDINKNYLEAVNTFLTQRFGQAAVCPHLRQANLSEQKWYSSKMRDFKRRITFTASDINQMYDTKYCRHFYTPDEISEMKSRWNVQMRPMK